MTTVTRTTNPNGTYRYELDGTVIYEASKVLYTHASHYVIGDSTPVLFHKTEAAAGKARGYAGWTKMSVAAIVDGDLKAEIAEIGKAVAQTVTADHPAIEAAMQRKSVRRAPRKGAKVRVNAEYPGQAYKGMTGRVHSKVTGDDGVRYTMVDFDGRTWPFRAHELDVI